MRGRKARACRVRQLTERVCVGLSECLGCGRHSGAYGRARGWFTECDQHVLPDVRAQFIRNDGRVFCSWCPGQRHMNLLFCVRSTGVDGTVQLHT